MEKFENAKRFDCVKVRVCGVTVKDVANALRAVAETLEQNYCQLDGKDSMLISDKTLSVFEYDHLPSELVEKWRNDFNEISKEYESQTTGDDESFEYVN